MVHQDHIHLSRRERQIMDVLYAADEASVADVHEALPDRRSYSTVRALMKKLLDKGHVRYRQDGARYVYRPVLAKRDAERGAITRLVDTFFDGSAANAVVGLMGRQGDRLTEADLKRIERELARLRERR
ncbi:MAG: BlaI/MecI/CopY family transcriptional regulator [Gammaproteobacteria bacterium]|nr:BlaI/MecI/CopY family transcriptional regulator [Gammaproteobacteria bacterium]